MVSESYFPVLKIPILQGRHLGRSRESSRCTVYRGQPDLARRYLPSRRCDWAHVQGSRTQTTATLSPHCARCENGLLIIVVVVADKLDDGLSKPVFPEAFAPYTVAMGMFTQILVRSEVPPLTLLHAIRAKVNSSTRISKPTEMCAILSIGLRDARVGARTAGRVAVWCICGIWRWHWPRLVYTVWCRIRSCSEPTSSAFGRSRGSDAAICSGSCFGRWYQASEEACSLGIVLTLALNKVMASWAAESSRDPLLLLGFGVRACDWSRRLRVMVPARRAAGVDPMTAIRYE